VPMPTSRSSAGRKRASSHRLRGPASRGNGVVSISFSRGARARAGWTGSGRAGVDRPLSPDPQLYRVAPARSRADRPRGPGGAGRCGSARAGAAGAAHWQSAARGGGAYEALGVTDGQRWSSEPDGIGGVSSRECSDHRCISTLNQGADSWRQRTSASICIEP
jgi:hypothetical protein